MKLIPTIVATLALGASLAACSEDEPAVCGSVDSLKASVDDVRGIDVTSSTALSDLESGLKAVGSDLSDVRGDAKAEFSAEVDTVQASYDALTASVDAAMTSASTATLGAAGTALSTFGTDVQTLITDVQGTC
jgi:hypothetical protein